ncbi:MAG: GvpL/GvpF family gas vesicle protein [Lentisphaerota bacterium]
MEIAAEIYVYCIIDDNTLDRNFTLEGIGGGEVFILPLNYLGVIAGDFRVKKENDPNYIKECAMQHEKIIESLMEKYTVLPVKFHTVFKDKISAINAFQKHYSDFEDNIKKLRNKIEYSLKVLWNLKEIQKDIDLNSLYGKSIIDGNSESKNYLKLKFRKYKQRESLKESAKTRADDISKYFDSFIADKKLHILQTDNLFLSAVYLIDKKDINSFKEAFDNLKKDMGGKYDFLLTGPWPPYNFITLKR